MLIKCPECGHQVSDKAPVCPNCGIEIAGLVKETQPINVEEPVVIATPIEEEPIPTPSPTSTTPVSYAYQQQQDTYQQPQNAYQPTPKAPKQRSHTTLWISFFIAAVICAVMLYIYKDASEQLAADEVVNMDKLRDMQEDVDSSLVSSKYKNQEPKAETHEEVESTGPSEDLESADNTDNSEASAQPSSSEPSTAEMEKATNAVRRFFRAINSHDKEALNNSVSPFLSNFNGKARATKHDVQQYMTDSYQADVKNINWYIGDIKNIKKREIGENRYEYDITLDAKKVTEREGGTSTHNYTIKAMVEADGKVGSMAIDRK